MTTAVRASPRCAGLPWRTLVVLLAALLIGTAAGSGQHSTDVAAKGDHSRASGEARAAQDLEASRGAADSRPSTPAHASAGKPDAAARASNATRAPDAVSGDGSRYERAGDASGAPALTVGDDDDVGQIVKDISSGLSNAVDGIRAANASLATTVEGLLQPAVAPETEPRAKIVSARAFNESRVREQARVAKQREAGTKDSQEQVIVALDGSPNQPCDAVCAAQDLACSPSSFMALNSCAQLRAAFGCEGGCIEGYGVDKPAAMRVAGHPFNLCFTNTAPTAHAHERIQPRFRCNAASSVSSRLCPCVERDPLQEERDRLRGVLLREQAVQRAEMERLHDLAHGVEKLLEKYNGTQAQLKQVSTSLTQREGELERIKAEEVVAAKAAQLSGPGVQVDYATGVVKLKSGETMTKEEVEEVVKRSTKSGKRSSHKVTVRDPAILVYDFGLLSNIGVLLVGAAFGGIASSVAQLPASLGYLIGGAVVGPSGLGLVTNWEQVGAVAQFGAVFPLFSMGLEFKPTDHRNFFRASLWCALAVLLGYSFVVSVSMRYLFGSVGVMVQALLVALPTALSSPGVTLSNLVDSGATTKRAGKTAIGMLAAQDLFMMVLLTVPHAVAVGVDAATAFQTIISICGLGALAIALSRLLRRPALVSFFSSDSHQDVLVLGLVALCLCMALVTGTLGLSLEMGAFLAGLTVTWMPDIKRSATSMEPLSRVFGGMFFASIGMLVSPLYVWLHLHDILQMLLLVVAVKVAVLAVALRAFGCGPRSSVSVAVASAQITEYSLMFTGKAHALGLLDRAPYLLWLSTTVMSLVVSPLLMRLYNVWASTACALLPVVTGGSSMRDVVLGGGHGHSHGHVGSDSDQDADVEQDYESVARRDSTSVNARATTNGVTGGSAAKGHVPKRVRTDSVHHTNGNGSHDRDVVDRTDRDSGVPGVVSRNRHGHDTTNPRVMHL